MRYGELNPSGASVTILCPPSYPPMSHLCPNQGAILYELVMTKVQRHKLVKCEPLYFILKKKKRERERAKELIQKWGSYRRLKIVTVSGKNSWHQELLHSRTADPKRFKFLSGWWLKCRFTSTETAGLLGTWSQEGHLDFHTAPELWPQWLMLLSLKGSLFSPVVSGDCTISLQSHRV